MGIWRREEGMDVDWVVVSRCAEGIGFEGLKMELDVESRWNWMWNRDGTGLWNRDGTGLWIEWKLKEGIECGMR